MRTNTEAQQYYESKYPKQTIFYTGRAVPVRTKPSLLRWGKTKKASIRYPVHEFILPDSFAVQVVAAPLRNVLSGLRHAEHVHDFAALQAQQFVTNRMTYVHDDAQTGYTDFWQFPTETLSLNTGDCEDGAHLMASVMLACGVPSWRVRVTCGMVEGGGHAYVTYCREYDNRWVILDWCYYQDPDVPVKDKPLLKEAVRYDLTKIWWSAAVDGAYGRNSMTFDRLPEN